MHFILGDDFIKKECRYPIYYIFICVFQSFGDQLLRGRQLSSGEQRRPRLWRKYTFMTRLNFSTFTEKLPRRSFCDFKVILNNFSIWQLQRKIKRRRNVPQTASSFKIELRKMILYLNIFNVSPNIVMLTWCSELP